MKFVGPPLDQGPLPAVFYFALSEDESLFTDPFNQPVQYLKKYPLRLFSFTIPGHGPGLNPKQAISWWLEQFAQGRDPLSPFFDQTAEKIISLAPYCSHMAAAGLSRGVFCAMHIASRVPAIQTLLGFAPMTQFKDLPLDPHIDTLCTRTLRFYIGNRDTRTGTEHTFNFMQKLVEAAFKKNIRSAPIELIIGPSIGHQGHGTAPHVFLEGSNWLLERFHV